MDDGSTLASWLRCPICERDLAGTDDGALVCTSGHRFERNRRGYAALFAGSASSARSESAASLDALDREWADGRFDEVRDAVAGMAPVNRAHGRVLDAGADAGHLLATVLDTRHGWTALVVGSSPARLTRAMTRAGAQGLLVGATGPWPVRESAADVVLASAGSHRPDEFHRILSPGGALLITTDPATAHELVDDLYPWFEHDQTRWAELAVIRLRRRRRPLDL